MASNFFGEVFRFTTWGESHGQAIGCVVDGCPSLIDICDADFEKDMQRRKPGQSKFTTQRKEEDTVQILSGVFNGKTTGTPISLIIWNTDQKSADYNEINDKFRPGHADYVYQEKYGIRDHRGGGRSSARETAMRVAAGVIAKKIVPQIEIFAYVVQLGKIQINRENFDKDFIETNPLFCPDPQVLPRWEEELTQIRKNGSSMGAVIEVVARNVPVGLGEPIYHKLDSEIAKAIMSINAVKGVEIGAGFGSASLTGEENADEMYVDEFKNVRFSSNNNGGTLGGISSGQDVIVRFAVKPTSSILTPRQTIDIYGQNSEISTKGRHDPCVGIRAVPIGEAMLACVLADAFLRARLISFGI
jgi:chorismate synthase